MSSLEQHPQWQTVLFIQQSLVKHGFRALVAGGAVRDLLLGRVPNDIDLATDARPNQVEDIFEKTVMVGREFGVSRVILNGHDIEVASFRKDGPYLDGRKPESIQFSSEKEDALRRDFTINGLFYDPKNSEVIDYVGGQKDIMKKVIRTIGVPSQRFGEDKLRILRGIRFHGQLNFTLDPQTLEAIKKQSGQIKQVSMERIRDEWGKILTSEHMLRALQKSYDTGLWGQLYPNWRFQFAEYKKLWQGRLSGLDKAWVLWFVFHNQASVKKLTELALEWKLPKKLIKTMIYCQQSLAQLDQVARIEPVDVAIFLGKPDSSLAVEIYKRLNQGKIKDDWTNKMKKAQAYFTDGRLPGLLVNGDDLIQYGIAPGPKIAKGLRDLYRIQIKDGIKNKENLLKHL